MGWSFSSIRSGIRDMFGLHDVDDTTSAQNALYEKARNVTTKSSEELAREGRAAAGAQAADKAGIAKRQAKAAATMGNAGKLQSALAGASAASQAAQEGYSEAANQATAQAAQADMQRAEAERQSYAAQAQNLAAKEEAERNRQAQRQNTLTSTFGSILGSDKDMKNIKKHTYIKAEERGNGRK